MNTVRRFSKNQEQDFRAYCAFEGLSFLTRNELSAILSTLGINATATNLMRNGVIEPVYKGKVYRVSDKSGTVTELLTRIFEGDEPVYLTGIYAYNAYGFIEQLPSRYQVANRKIQREKSIAGYGFIFSKVNDKYFYGIDRTACLPVKERALIDFCHSFGYERFIEALTDQRAAVDLNTLIRFALQYPVNKVARRVLYGVDSLDRIDDDIRTQLDAKSLITLTERNSREGRIDTRFNIIINQ